MREAIISREKGEATLAGGHLEETGVTLTFPRNASQATLPDERVLRELHRNHAYKLEWKAYELMNRAKLAYLSAAQARRVHGQDERGAQANAARADTLHHLIQTSRPYA